MAITDKKNSVVQAVPLLKDLWVDNITKSLVDEVIQSVIDSIKPKVEEHARKVVADMEPQICTYFDLARDQFVAHFVVKDKDDK